VVVAAPVEAVLHSHRSVNCLLKFGADLRTSKHTGFVQEKLDCWWWVEQKWRLMVVVVVVVVQGKENEWQNRKQNPQRWEGNLHKGGDRLHYGGKELRWRRRGPWKGGGG
jgi:hypothetical protein